MSWRRYLRRAAWDRERRAEIDSYVRIETDENVARGMSPNEAHAAAHRKFGNTTLVREEIYRMNTLAFLDTLARDVRYGLRTLRQNPTFTTVALLTLAIGIGANTAVFSVVNSVLLKPLPYPNPEQLVSVQHRAPGAAGIADITGDLRLSASMYFTYAEQNRTFQAIGGWSPLTATVTGFGEPEEVRAVAITDGTLQAFNIPPVLGRWMGAADQKQGAATVMLGYGYWQRRFGGDRSVIGRSITVDSRSREIVGVMPEGFRTVTADPELLVPFGFNRNALILPGFFMPTVARLKPGVTLAEANADIARLVPVWMTSWPAAPTIDWRIYQSWQISPVLRQLKDDVVGNVTSVLWVVMGTIGIVMLIACANVANLLLVRAEARQQELSVRAALGAGWGRIVRGLLLESVLLSFVGGALGLSLAYAGLRFLVTVGPSNLPRMNEIALDPRALAFAFAVSLLSGLLFGLIPALKYAGPRVATTLRSGGRTASHSRERHRARSVLVVVQVGLALVLLISAGLMIRTFQALRRVEPGFGRPEQIQTVRISVPGLLIQDNQRVARLQNDIVDKLAAIPGVTSVGFASTTPLDGRPPNWDSIRAEGKEYPPNRTPGLRMFRNVSPGYFQSMGTRLIAGRDYEWPDLYGDRRVVMISENLARELWGDPQSAVGKQVRTLPVAPLHEVIGVVQDVRENGVHAPSPAAVFWPVFGTGPYAFTVGPDNRLVTRTAVTRNATFVIRSERAGTEGFLNQVRQAVWSVNPSLPVGSERTMQEVYDQSLARISFTLVMLGIASAMAMLLGIVGIYGVIAYAVSQRRREIGIRLALGAQQAELRRMFVRYGLSMAGIGVAVGLVAAAGLSRVMRSLLFEVSPLDPLTYAAVPVVLVAAAVFASYVPARRASTVDPVEALRAE